MIKSRILAVYRSFYDATQYRETALSWRGFGGSYLLIVASITALLIYVPLLFTISTFQGEAFDRFIEQLPPITIADGRIQVEAEQPVIINIPPMSMIIDTTMSETDMRATKNTIGIGSDFVFMQADNDTYRVHKLTNEGSEEPIIITKESVHAIIDKNLPSLKVIMFPLMWAGQFVNLLLGVLAISALSYVITAFMKEEFFFLTRMRLAALAITPPMLITVILQMVLFHQSAPWLPIILSCLYFYVMVMLMRRLGPPIIEVEAPPVSNG